MFTQHRTYTDDRLVAKIQAERERKALFAHNTPITFADHCELATMQLLTARRQQAARKPLFDRFAVKGGK